MPDITARYGGAKMKLVLTGDEGWGGRWYFACETCGNCGHHHDDLRDALEECIGHGEAHAASAHTYAA